MRIDPITFMICFRIPEESSKIAVESLPVKALLNSETDVLFARYRNYCNLLYFGLSDLEILGFVAAHHYVVLLILEIDFDCIWRLRNCDICVSGESRVSKVRNLDEELLGFLGCITNLDATIEGG